MSQLSGWPAVTNDSGTGQDGTPADKAFTDAVKASIEDQVYDAANPTKKPKDFYQEIINARGSMASVDARLDVALEENGTPKPVAGQATETQVGKAQGQRNLVVNGDMERWSAGSSAAPDGWTLSGAGAAVAQSGPGMGDTTVLGVGTYVAKVTSGGGATAKLTAPVMPAADISRWANVKGRKIAALARVKTTLASTVRIVVDDGIGTTASSFHAGGDVAANLTVAHTLSASATKLDIYLEVAQGANVAYFGGVSLIFSDIVHSDWLVSSEPVPIAGIAGNSKYRTGFTAIINQQITDAASSGTGETAGHTFTLPANLLANNGDRVILRVAGNMTANSNVKTVKVSFGGVLYQIASSGVANSTDFFYEIEIVRTGASAEVLFGRCQFHSNTGVALTAGPAFSTPAVATSGTIALSTTIQMATAGTITEKFWEVEFVPAPATAV